MKKTRIQYISIGIACIALFLLWHQFGNPFNKNILPIWDAENEMKNELIQIDDCFHNYSRADCNFLKESSSLKPDDIRNVHCYENDLYMLFPNLFLKYDLNTGDLLFRYKPSELVDFVDFTFDLATDRAYILDNKGSQVVELAMNGEIIKTVRLDPEHSYAMIKQLENHVFLIPEQTIPYPSFVKVDFEKGEVKNYEFISHKKTHDIPKNSDSTWTKYPLYVADEIPEGVMVKYLFDDHVYFCRKNEVKKKYLINMGRQKVKFKYPWTITKLKNNDRFRILKFWHGSKKTYVLSQQVVKNAFGIYDYRTLSQVHDFKNVDSYSGYMAINNLASLNPYKDELFMDYDRNRFLSFRKMNNKEKMEKNKWPKHMLETDNEDDLVISSFNIK